MKISIIINYHSGKAKLLNTIDSVLKNKPNYAELIIVDNSESDQIVELKKNKKLIYLKSSRNRGFGAGNNLGAANTSGKYLFFLNPDTLINKKTIPNLVKFLENPKNKKVAVVGPNLLDPDGNVFPQLGSNTLTPLRGMIALSFVNTVFPNNKISREYWLLDQDVTKNREVSVVPGSAICVRRDVFEKINGFDENIFLFFDESDLCYRVMKLGYKVCFVANSQVVHIWKFDNRVEDKSLKRHFVNSRFYYFRKHYGIAWAIAVEIFTRMSRILALFF